MKKKTASRRRRTQRGPIPLPFTLTVEYSGGPDSEFEQLLEKTVGVRGQREGSGYAFYDKMRDVEFGFKSRATAIAVAKRVKSLVRARVMTNGCEFPKRVRAEVSGRIWP